MELSSYASPGFLLGLTQALSDTKEASIAPTIDSRLNEAGFNRSWLVDMADNLKTRAENEQDYPLRYGSEYCQFLSWVCAPLKGNSYWLNINAEASKNTTKFYSALKLPTPTNVQLLCWVTSYPINNIELNYPTHILVEDLDPDLKFAFLNLVDHLASHTWQGEHKEIDTTSLTVRLAGLVNSLEPSLDLRPGIQARILGLRGLIPSSDMTLYNGSDWINSFMGIRNAIAHVSEKGDGLYSLSEAWERSRVIDHVASVVRLCSYIMANEMRGNLQNVQGKHARAWADRVNEEMG